MLFKPTDEYLARELPEEDWLVDRLLPRGGTVLVHGLPKSGKSLLCLTLLSDIAEKKEHFLIPEFKINVPDCKVMVLQLDTGPSLWMEYIHHTKKKFGKNILWCDPLDIVSAGLDPPFNVENPKHLEALRNEVQLVEPDLIMIDSLREIHYGDDCIVYSSLQRTSRRNGYS